MRLSAAVKPLFALAFAGALVLNASTALGGCMPRSDLADTARADLCTPDGSPLAAASDADGQQGRDVFVPAEMETLQDINAYGVDQGIADDSVTSSEMSLEMRMEAQKEAALSYGARGGLSKRSYQIAERIKGYEAGLDKIYNFRALLIQAPSGMLIEPPIIAESIDTLKVTQGGFEAAVADRIYDISKAAVIVTAPRDWRHYLVQEYGPVAHPPKILWPQNAREQANWSKWVEAGWKQGFEQADDIFEANLARLNADFNGMVRYRMLLAQGVVSQPFLMHEDRGVVADATQMRVGDRALRITSPSSFQAGPDTWKPADR